MQLVLSVCWFACLSELSKMTNITNLLTDGRYQVHYLPNSLSYAVDNNWINE